MEDTCEYLDYFNWEIKRKYLKQGIAEYLKRLSAYAKVEVIELPDEKAPENLSEAEMLIVKEKKVYVY